MQKKIFFLVLLLQSCMPGSPVDRNDLRSCLETIDKKLLVTDQNPNGFIDVSYNQAYGLPLLTLRPENKSNIRILSMNIGHGESGDLHKAYDLRMTFRTYEDAIAARIQQLNPKPQIIALQEVLTKKRCNLMDPIQRSLDLEKTCWDQSTDQVQRMVGNDYYIVCDGNEGIDCLAINKSFATISGLSGNYNPSFKAFTAPLPPKNSEFAFRTCDYSAGECEHDLNICDAESSIAYADLNLTSGQKMRVVFVHPTARGENCQQAQLIQAFDFATKHSASKTLILGDWNMDMVRMVGSHSLAVIYKKFIGTDREFRLHDNFNESCTFTKTAPKNVATIDHVVSNFARGVCRVYTDFGISSKYYSPLKNFDDGVLEEIFQGSEIPKTYKERRMDHKHLLCDLYVP